MKFQKGHKTNVGRKRSTETKMKISKSNKGRISPMLGKKMTLESRLKLSSSLKGRIGSFKGRKHSEESKEKLRLANLGKIHTPETRKKLSDSHKGIKLPREQIIKMIESRKWYKPNIETKQKQKNAKLGENNPNYGKKPSLEHRMKISKSLKITKARTRNISFQELQHEIRNSPLYKEWRESVFKRDSYKCIWCGFDKGKILNADHIKPFILIIKQNNILSVQEANECIELWDINNGRTLCAPCHRTTDTWGTKANT